MAIRDKTIDSNFINIDSLNNKIDVLQVDINQLQQNKKFIGSYNTETNLHTAHPNPQNGDWATILNSENISYLNQQVQYIASDGIWVFFSSIDNINEATNTTKGILKLAGSLSGSADLPTLNNTGVLPGQYSIFGNVMTVAQDGRILNINVTQNSIWTYESLSGSRNNITNTFTVPLFDTLYSEIYFYWNGNLLVRNRDWIIVDNVTIKCLFNVQTDDDVVIINTKYQGELNIDSLINDSTTSSTTVYSSTKTDSIYAKLDNNIVPKNARLYDLGTTGKEFKDIYVYNSPIITSSRQEKTDIQNTSLGLEFINSLTPRNYRMKNGRRLHQGFISDEIKQVMDNFNVDFGLYVKDENGKEALRYEELIPILSKAIIDLTPWYKKIWFKFKSKFIKNKKL